MKRFDRKRKHKNFGENFEDKWHLDKNTIAPCPNIQRKINESLDNNQLEIGKNVFPTDLVSYLRQISIGIPDNGKLDQLIIDRCLEECNGQETNLLGYQESSRLVEKIFSCSNYGAFEFLKKLNRVKRKKRADMLFQGVSAHTIESLLVALIPLKTMYYEVISEWMEIIVEFWNDLVMDRSASHVIRSFAYLLFGITLPKDKIDQQNLREPKFSSSDMANIMQKEFLKIANLALDYTSMKDYMSRPTISLLMQDVIELDVYAKSGKVMMFVMKALEDHSFIEKSFCGRETSRIWEKIILAINNDTREILYNTLSRNIKKIATDSYGNFPMSKLISLANSDEMVTDICDELFPLIQSFVADNKHFLISALIKCISKKPDVQLLLIKELKKAFHSSEKKFSVYFVPQVLCMNNIDKLDSDDGAVRFNVKYATVPGALLLKDLFNLDTHRSICKSMLAIHPEVLNQMAMHPVASHAIDHFLLSPVIDMNNKIKVAQKFDWPALIGDKFGSRVFDSFWENVDIQMQDRELIMEQFANILQEKSTPIFRIMSKKLEVKEFRQDKLQWKRNFEKKVKQNTTQGKQQDSKIERFKNK